MSKNRVVPPRFFTFCIFAFIWIKLQKNAKKMPKNGIFVIFRVFENVYSAYTPCFCCKGRQSPWQKPANLYSTKCRIFMRQNPLSRVTVHDSCTTQRRDKYFSEKNIFYSSRNFVLTKFLKKIFKKIFYFWKNIFGKKYFYKNFLEKKFFILNLRLNLFFI